jgi:hypothetical protein
MPLVLSSSAKCYGDRMAGRCALSSSLMSLIAGFRHRVGDWPAPHTTGEAG